MQVVGIEDGERGGIPSEAERDGADHGQGKQWRPAESAQGVANVLKEANGQASDLPYSGLRFCQTGSMKTEIISYNPATGAELGRIPLATGQDYDQAADRAARTFEKWRMLPAPQRGEIVREIGDELRKAKADLGRLVTLEAGKISAEGQGEVQEMIDIAGFALGLSRQLYGLTMPS